MRRCWRPPIALGGRVWTRRNAFASGLVVERGGELIDTGHVEIRQLCQELRLALDNLDRAEAAGTDALYHFDGAPYTVAEAEDDFNGVYQSSIATSRRRRIRRPTRRRRRADANWTR